MKCENMVPTLLGLRVFFAKTLAVVGIGILLLAPLAVLGHQGAEQNGTVGSSHLAAHAVAVQSRGAPHAPIYINGNDDFASQAANERWPGDGTEQNPYIIAGYEIDGNGGSSGISIENTDVWFVIRNCKVWNATGIVFGGGIYLCSVRHGIIEHNECSGNRGNGISVQFSCNITIRNNNCSYNYYGINLESDNNYVVYNELYQNTHYGIKVGGEHNQIYHNNFIENNGAISPAIPYSQAEDYIGNNLWYNPETKEGNYWSNWNGKGTYKIDGYGEDPYPLGHKVGEESMEWLYWLIAIIVITVIVICIAIIVVRRHKKKRMEVEAMEGSGVEFGDRETAVPVAQGEKMVCSRCGASIPGDANYCPFCTCKVR